MQYNMKAILFDLDGVIIFTDKYHYFAWKKISDEEGLDFDKTVNEKLRGVSRMESLQIILEHNSVDYSIEMKTALAERKNEIYLQYLKEINEKDLFPGVINFILNLKKKGIKIGLCSSSKNAIFAIEKLNILNLFDTIVSGNDIKNTKPDPEIFLLAAERLGLHPLNCLVFEDAEAGVKGAVAAKMKCIGVGDLDFSKYIEESIKNYEEIDIEELLVSGRKSKPPTEPWTIAETDVNLKKLPYWESIFAVNNGYMGIRGTFEEDDSKLGKYTTQGMYINSIYGVDDHFYISKKKGYPERWHGMLNLFDWTIINLKIDDEIFSMFTGEILSYRRELDMKSGVVNRFMLWQSPKGKQVEIKITRLVSMIRKHSAAIRYEVKPLNFSGNIEFESVLKHKVENGQFGEHAVIKVDNGTIDNTYYFTYKTQRTDFKIAMAIEHKLSKEFAGKVETLFKEDEFNYSETVYAESGEVITFDKHACFYTSFDEIVENLKDLVVSGVEKDVKSGFNAMSTEQRKFWNDFWAISDIEIEGQPEDQQALRFNMFHLMQGHAENDRMSISATGMTGNNYCGHIYWDTEMYMVPFFLYTKPELVRPLLMYRYNILDRARERAIQMEGKGALFAWSSLSGEEANPSFEAATAQYHINSDIVYAISKYVNASGDKEFLYNYGAEIVFETARFMYERGKFILLRGNKFCINMVCGPDEYGCMVNNNTYTNMMTQFLFDYAISVYYELKTESPETFKKLISKISLVEEEIVLFKKASENMFINFNEELGIHAQDDSYLFKDPMDMEKLPKNVDVRENSHPLNSWKIQVTKQADVVLLMFTLGDKFCEGIKLANYDFYEYRTVHSSSLSPAVHSIIASEIGYDKQAYDFFQQSLYLDIKDLRRNTNGGIHFACLGGTWMDVINGFAGMRAYDNELLFNPKIPDAWKSYKFNFKYKGRMMEIFISKDKTTFNLISGEPIEIKVNGQTVNLC